MLYLIKFVLCSGLFYLAYVLLLEKEKVHVFKRYYLLASLFLSLAIPLLTIERNAPVTEPLTTAQASIVVPAQNNNVADQASTIPVQERTAVLPYLLMAGCISVSLVLLIRFARHLFILLGRIRNSEKLSWNGSTLILSEDCQGPYSFANYIFINRTDYEQRHIAEEIMQHEWAHVQQKHSVDVILIELFQVFFWFNPLLYFYRRAIRTNHEYLADAHVINHCRNVAGYQLLLIQQVSKQNGLTLVSSFNYLTIKKRLIMMGKTYSMKRVIKKQLALVPVLGLAIAVFATRTVAQPNLPQSDHKPATAASNGISEAELAELQAILVKYKLQKKSEHNFFFAVRLAKPDENRLFELYRKMSAQQSKKLGAKISYIEPAQAKVPTKSQLVQWLNSKKYGIWIDEKRVDNAELAKYQAADFDHWLSSKLSPSAYNYGKHYYQINLMTKAYYKAYLEKASQHKLVVVNYKNLDPKVHSTL